MKKHKIGVVVVVVLISIVFLYFKYIYAWMEFRKNTDTPKTFFNHTVVTRNTYSKDSSAILKRLEMMRDNHVQSFDRADYFESTQIFCDTILYAPDSNRMGVFFITKNSTSRQAIPDRDHDWYYDGACYLVIKNADTKRAKEVGIRKVVG